MTAHPEVLVQLRKGFADAEGLNAPEGNTRPSGMAMSATAWKRIKMGKMKMVRFSGIKFAAGLAYETLNPLPSHEIRRTRIRRQFFSTDAKKKIVHFQIAGIDAVLGRR